MVCIGKTKACFHYTNQQENSQYHLATHHGAPSNLSLAAMQQPRINNIQGYLRYPHEIPPCPQSIKLATAGSHQLAKKNRSY